MSLEKALSTTVRHSLTVNGEQHESDVEPRQLLVHYLRDDARPDRHARGL